MCKKFLLCQNDLLMTWNNLDNNSGNHTLIEVIRTLWLGTRLAGSLAIPNFFVLKTRLSILRALKTRLLILRSLKTRLLKLRVLKTWILILRVLKTRLLILCVLKTRLLIFINITCLKDPAIDITVLNDPAIDITFLKTRLLIFIDITCLKDLGLWYSCNEKRSLHELFYLNSFTPFILNSFELQK